MPSVPNHKLVTPAERAKLAPLLRHYAKSAHPFTQCVAENRKRFGPRTEQVCAVVKDLIRGTTMWRGKGKELSASDLQRVVDLADASGADCDDLRRLRVLADQAGAVDLAGRSGKVAKQVKVRNAKGTVYTRTVWVNPEQLARARADRKERVKGDAPPIVAPSQTNDHARAGLRRLGPNVYVDGKGKAFKRVGKGNSSSFAPLTPKEARAVKRVVRRAVAQRAFIPTKPKH